MATGRWRAIMVEPLDQCSRRLDATANSDVTGPGHIQHLRPHFFALFSQTRSSDANTPMRHAHWNAYQPLVLRLGQAAATGNFLELFPVDDAYVTPR